MARVPFSPEQRSSITIALELPDGLVVSIDAVVEGVRQAPDGKKSAIRMSLSGMSALRPRLERAVAKAREELGEAEARVPTDSKLPRTDTGLFVPIPSDAPIDEPVEFVQLPRSEDVSEDVRERYIELEKSLATMREKAAHDVLGVAWDAEVADIRQAYFAMVKRYHPDVVSKHDSAAISLLASEIFIYINKAYDRLRDSAVAAGRAIVAGPALLPSSGWMATFDDIGNERPRASHIISDYEAPVPVPVKALSSLAVNAPQSSSTVEVRFTGGDSGESNIEKEGLFDDARSTESGMKPLDDRAEPVLPDAGELQEGLDDAKILLLIEQGHTLLDEKKYNEAREVLAALLEQVPRNREARALYHVAYGYTLQERGEEAAAMTQFDVALKHNSSCQPAFDARSKNYAQKRARRPSFLERLFRR